MYNNPFDERIASACEITLQITSAPSSPPAQERARSDSEVAFNGAPLLRTERGPRRSQHKEQIATLFRTAVRNEQDEANGLMSVQTWRLCLAINDFKKADTQPDPDLSCFVNSTREINADRF